MSTYGHPTIQNPTGGWSPRGRWIGAAALSWP